MRIPKLAYNHLALALAAALVTPFPATAGTPGEDKPHVATVRASSLPLASAEEAVLTRQFDLGTPVVLHMDARSPDDLAHVTALFGIAPTEGDVILWKDRGAVQVFARSPDSGADLSDLLHATVAAEAKAAEKASSFGAQIASLAAQDESAAQALPPARHFDVNIVDATGEISGVTGIDIVRSRTLSSDFKMVTVTSKATIKTADNGILDGSRTGKNLWAAYLPLEYRLRHSVTAGDQEVTYLDHFPVTDGRTEFTQNDTEIRGFTVGGSTGSEISQSGKADETLAAKLPFNVSLGYEHKWQSSLTTTFNDYSVQAFPSAPSTVTWKALIAPKLEHVLVKRWGADMPQLSEERMTPMMRAATFEAMSYWKIPGDHRGLANVMVTAGYDLDRKEWWWKRANIEHARTRVPREVAMDFVIDLTDPYLSAEITVLIRSETGSGACLRDNGGVVDLVACQSTDRSQMWGLDNASRYVNRGSGRCLTAQPATTFVVTEDCRNITFEKQWRWFADRLHSFADPRRYRLYAEGSQVRLAAPGRFPDFPANPHADALEPWTSYPAAPRPGVDHIRGPAGTRIEQVNESYATFPAVTADQRWHIEVLRQGL